MSTRSSWKEPRKPLTIAVIFVEWKWHINQFLFVRFMWILLKRTSPVYYSLKKNPSLTTWEHATTCALGYRVRRTNWRTRQPLSKNKQKVRSLPAQRSLSSTVCRSKQWGRYKWAYAAVRGSPTSPADVGCDRRLKADGWALCPLGCTQTPVRFLLPNILPVVTKGSTPETEWMNFRFENE